MTADQNRAALSAWDTPAWLATKMVAWSGAGKGASVVEPSAGTGVIAEVAHKAGAHVLCVEKDPARHEELIRKGFEAHRIDWLESKLRLRGLEGCTFICNPPHENAVDHLAVMIAHKPAKIIALLPLAFLEGRERYSRIWGQVCLSRLAILVSRFRTPGTGHSAQRPFAVYSLRLGPKPSSLIGRHTVEVEWWVP